MSDAHSTLDKSDARSSADKSIVSAEFTHQPSKLMSFWRSSWTQLYLISIICFCCPGIYNSIQGIGGSGQLDPTVAANATVGVLAGTAATAFTLVPPLFDILGPRGCLLVSAWTYALYSGALLCYNHTGNAAFVIASGGILGVGASFLWIAQGDIMISYPSEGQKGRAIGLFWVIFNLGGSVGGFMSFGLNFHSKSGTVSDSTYAAFIAVMAFGWLISAFILPPTKVVRPDGTRPQPHEKARFSFKHQLTYFYYALNMRILLLIPMFFCANIPYSYQQNIVNGGTFTIRSRSLNSALYWFAQMFGGMFIGIVLDLPFFKRSTRAKIGWGILFVLTMVIWGGGYAFQVWYDRMHLIYKVGWLDFDDAKAFVGPCFLYFFYGFYDACFQSLCYWAMGSLSNSPLTLARYVGLYKTFQATGGAMAWRLTALKTPAITQFAMNWGILSAALIVALPTFLVISDTTTAQEWETEMQDDEAREIQEAKA